MIESLLPVFRICAICNKETKAFVCQEWGSALISFVGHKGNEELELL